MKLYEFQKEILEKTEKFNRVAYYLDMGLGKTFIGTQKMIDLGAAKNLVVCQKSKLKDWLEHLRTYCADKAVLNLRNTKEFIEFIACPEVIGVINYESMFRRAELLKLRDFTLMFDESS